MSKVLCLRCGEDDIRVIDSRLATSHHHGILPKWVTSETIRRRKKCMRCDERWTTYEIVAEDLDRSEEIVKQRLMNEILTAFSPEAIFAWCIAQGPKFGGGK